MRKRIKLNEGAQGEFVANDHRYSAYIGGLGSGKTFAGIVRGLQFAQQDKVSGSLFGPRGLVGAINYPVLQDVVLPQFFDIIDGTGLLKDYIRGEKKAILTNGAEILFRSLDEPNRIRGVELSWFFIDEGRHLTRHAWDILVGRLRQRGYDHAGWVCSTPNGYDWMYETFHPKSVKALGDSAWYGASTYANRHNVGESYIQSLEATYEGRFFKQEVMGEFVGVVAGSVFPQYNAGEHMVPLEYDERLPLFTGWDFGIGDPGVILFIQVAWRERLLPPDPQGLQKTVLVPELRVLDYVEAKDWSPKDWTDAYQNWCIANTDGVLPVRNWGDPAGRQRQSASGTSMIDALAAEGVQVGPAPIRPRDYGITVLQMMMEGGRVLVNENRAQRVSDALSTYRWNIDDSGNKVGITPVHDWTSHLTDALRYFAVAELAHGMHRVPGRPEKVSPPPGTMGFLVKQMLDSRDEEWLGPQPERTLDWRPAARLG